jgi:hypothetical protein
LIFFSFFTKLDTDVFYISENNLSFIKKWIEQNQNNYHPSREDINFIAKVTDSSFQKVYDRFRRERMKLKQNKTVNRVYSIENKKIFSNFFENVSDTPGPVDLAKLSQLSGLSVQIIKKWFIRQRFSKSIIIEVFFLGFFLNFKIVCFHF